MEKGETRRERGEVGGRRRGGCTARTKPPCHSHPALDALMPAMEGWEGSPGLAARKRGTWEEGPLQDRRPGKWCP